MPLTNAPPHIANAYSRLPDPATGMVAVLQFGLSRLLTDIGQRFISIDLDALHQEAEERQARKLQHPSTFWPDHHAFLEDLADYMGFPVRPSAPPESLELLPWAFPPDATTLAERRAIVSQLAKTAGRDFLSSKELEESFARRRYAMTMLRSFGMSSTAFGERMWQQLEDNFVSSRRANERLYHALMSAAHLKPSPIFESDVHASLDAADSDGESHLTCTELVTLVTSALFEGLDLRRFVEPMFNGVVLPSGPGGTEETWPLTALAFDAVHAMVTVDGAGEPRLPLFIEPDWQPSAADAQRSRLDADEDRRALLSAAIAIHQQEAKRVFDSGPDPQLLSDEARRHGVDAASLRQRPADFIADAAIMVCSESSNAWNAGRQHAFERELITLTAATARDYADRSADERSLIALRELCRLFGAQLSDPAPRQNRMSRRLPFLSGLVNFGHHDDLEQSTETAAAQLRQTLEDSTLSATYSTAKVLAQLVRHLNRRPRSDLFGFAPDSMEYATEIVATIYHTLGEGIALREQFDPLCAVFSLRTGPNGESQRWDLSGFSIACCLTHLFEFDDESA